MTLSEETRFLVDFNVHDVASALGLTLSDDAAALIYGISQPELNAYQAQIDSLLRQQLASMADQPEVGQFLARYQAGQSVLFIGDSITTYRYSYARMIAHLLRLRDVTVKNLAYSGYTSVHGLELTYTRFLPLKPDWVFIKYGVNDCKRFGGSDQPLLVDDTAYRRNISGMVQAFRTHTDAQIVLLTPTLVSETVVSQDPGIAAMRLTWRNEDLVRYGDIVMELAFQMDAHSADLRHALGQPPDVSLMCADGLHPNAQGQVMILQHIIEQSCTW